MITNHNPKLNHNPVDRLKCAINAVINAVNGVQDQLHFTPLEGDYEPAYLYGNPKVNKSSTDPPLRPIISQVPSPTYNIATELNHIITPYLPQKYSIKSTDELLLLLRTSQPKGILAPLDVENLFTNVPVSTTIDVIIKNVYENSEKCPPKITKTTLKSLLELCTMKAPFRILTAASTIKKTE